MILSVGAPEDLRGAVLSLLAQDPQPAEIVVVNSGGGDAVAAVHGLLPESAVIHSEELLRHGAARNCGIAATRAAYVAFLSADCRALPGWIAGRQRLHGQGHSVVASAVVNRSPGRWSATAAHAVLFSRRMPGTPPGETLRFGCSYERGLFDRFGLFDEELIGNEDSDFNSRLEAADIELVWAPDVRTAHPHPTAARVLLADQYRRGRRMAEWRQGVQGIPAASVARDTVTRIPSDSARAWRSAEPGERTRLALSAPLIAAAATAYAIGAASATKAPVRRPRRQQRFRLIAMLSFRNEMRFLPDYFANISPTWTASSLWTTVQLTGLLTSWPASPT